jgi:hypothetical protein
MSDEEVKKITEDYPELIAQMSDDNAQYLMLCCIIDFSNRINSDAFTCKGESLDVYIEIKDAIENTTGVIH